MTKMKNSILFALMIGLTIIGTSCTKELDENPSQNTPATSMSDLDVSESFDFSTSQILNVNITAEDLKGMPATKIDIYNGNPNESGVVIKTGITDKNQEFKTTVEIPANQTTLHIRRTTYLGNIETVTMDISSTDLEYTFATRKSAVNFKGNVTGPGCNDCTESITGNSSGNLKVEDGEVICIQSGASHTGNLQMRGGTIKICGTLIPTGLNGDGTIIINDDGTFISNSLNLNDSDITFENYSDAFMVSSGPNVKGTFKNYGIINMAGCNVNSGGSFYNYGTINFSNHFNNNEYLYNEGTMNISGNVANNGGATVDNHCKLIISGNLQNNSTFNNYSYIKITARLTNNNGGGLHLYDQALIECSDLMVNEDISGHGDDYNKIIVTNNTTINNATISGSIDLCDENDIETNNGTITPSVTFCEASIPVTYCNPGSEGSGGSGGNDTDEDGASDEFDDYPEDPNRAFNNYFPSENTFGTLGFEDLWPYKGDYDFNDLVVDYNFNTVTNANDNAVEIYVKLKVRAIGAAYKNGFGIQLPISADAVSQVSGDFSLTQNFISTNTKNLENGQSNAVIVFFDNAFDLLPHPGDGTGVNTRNGSIFVEPTEINFLITMAYPVSTDNLGLAPFNPFIFVNGDRGREIHLKNNPPTDLVNTNFFGDGQDASEIAQGLYYKTENNLPWAINIIEEFDYPIEKTAVINAYNYFAQWAESSGSQYSDWYSDAPGYRNNANIFNH